MQPIPNKLLIHSVMLHKTVSRDRWGKGGLDRGTELEKVRMEPSAKIIRDKNNAEVQLAATLFYDCHNSRPRDVAPEVDDLVVFHGQKFSVKMVEPLYDGKRLHHYEMGLVKHA